jgi:tRNA threonylcarbamoyladenosine biosynthesis protein TsaE
VETTSEAETRAVASCIAPTLAAGDVLLVSGDLGAGKTAFVRGVAEGLGIDPDLVSSPTFTIVHDYGGGRVPLVHVDLYRLERADLYDLGLDPELANRGVVAVEWPERLNRPPANALRVRILDAGGDRRQIEITPPPSEEPAGER